MLKTKLKKYASEDRRRVNERFFKTAPGEYGAGDKFLGVRVPDIRRVARAEREMELDSLAGEFDSKWHEVRHCAVFILLEKDKRAKKAGDKEAQKHIAEFYLKHLVSVNNWDLVDCSAQYILGEAILNGLLPAGILHELARSENMWHRRVAIIATWAFTRAGDFAPTLTIAKMLLGDTEDLTHKAVGWMLREVWKKSDKGAQMSEAFLRDNYNKLPRTTLRYAIERMSEEKRQRFLHNFAKDI